MTCIFQQGLPVIGIDFKMISLQKRSKYIYIYLYLYIGFYNIRGFNFMGR